LIAALSLRRARRGRLLGLLAILFALPAVASIASWSADQDGGLFFDTALRAILRFLVPIALALQASATIAEEVQGRTISYLFSRPIPRWTVPLGKWLATVAANALLTSASVVATYLVCMGGASLSEISRLALGLVGGLLAVLHYAAVAAAFGSLAPRSPLAAMTIYLLLVDVGLGFVPGAFKTVSMGIHLTVIAGLYRPHGDSYFMADPQLTAMVSLPVLLGATAIFLLMGLGWVSGHEVRQD
jgi:ABC-type transport system involved in multi-copper enzyme maturation permease subunit